MSNPFIGNFSPQQLYCISFDEASVLRLPFSFGEVWFSFFGVCIFIGMRCASIMVEGVWEWHWSYRGDELFISLLVLAIEIGHG